MKRVHASVVVAAVLMLVAPAFGAQAPPQASTPAPAQATSLIIEKIIVKVNGEILTQTELERIQVETLREQNKQVSSSRDLVTDAGLIKALSEITPTLLAEKIDELLIVQYGREMGVKFTEENFKFAIDNIKKVNKLDDKQLVVALKEAGLTMDMLRQNFERTFISEQVDRREIMKNLTLTEEEARQHFKAHPEQFMKPPTVTLREILVSIPTNTVGGQATINVAKDEEAKAKIDGIRARALKGEDFAALVTEASESGTKANGGIIGPMLVEELTPAVGAAVGNIKTGEITEVLRLGNGYRIFKLEARTAAEVEPFEKVRNEISERIYDERRGVEREKFLTKLRTQALIEWKDDSYKKMFEAEQAKRAKTGQ